ncbi:sedoheptulose 7-phosphate cyclase [Alphaproteobacteria bacterium]|nr:sedoheptulose 7-phosphate cyclase [Alphaproteobacteria bacterium]
MDDQKSMSDGVDIAPVADFLRTRSIKRSWNIEATLPVSFIIKYSSSIFSPNNNDLLEFGQSKRRFVAIDRAVFNIFKEEILNFFEQQKINCRIYQIDCSEEHKNIDTLNDLLREFEEFKLLRKAEPIIAVGGGVLLDIVGFAASIYRRGVPYVRVPTTLLALIDASVGAKTAINHFDRRNRLGTYYPPIVAYIDRKFLKTQSDREISNGLGEIFKIALIKDAELFDLLARNATELIKERFQLGAIPVRVINRAISSMVEELAPNIWEDNLERCVDFGHSFSPLIEMKSLPNLLHGEAVCLDCLFSSCIAANRGLLTLDELQRVFSTAQALELPTRQQYFRDTATLHESLVETERHRNGNQYLPLPCGIGSYVFCNDLSRDEIDEASKVMEQMG